jgi:hypothetical protein
MVHVTDEVYRDLEEYIMEGHNGLWEYGPFGAYVKSTVEYEKVYTGVEHLGAREYYLKAGVTDWVVEEFFHEDEEETDFDLAKICVD